MEEEEDDQDTDDKRAKSVSIQEHKSQARVEEHFSHETVQPQKAYIIKPSLQDKFKANPIKDIIQQTLNSVLGGRTYEGENAKVWTVKIANLVNQNIRDLHMRRYKHIVQVTIGELKGAGVKSGLRCLWDAETDSYTSEIFMNDSIFAVVVVFGVYLY